jgi:hypothetical protein
MIDGIDHDGDGETPVRSLPLRRASGTFMMASSLAESGEISATATATAVYYYETTSGKQYVRSTGTATTEGGVTTYSYQPVSIRAGAKIPAGNDYDHIHFGLWADLKTVDTVSGANELSSLGIGFVTALKSGDGMTAEMPNHGDAKYSGNYVAAIQAAHPDGEGTISFEDGAADITANFRKGTVEIGMEDFVTLDGDIADNRFSKSYADAELDFDDTDLNIDGVQAAGSLNASGEYDGMVNGGFFGDDAEEIGGVFEFTSADNEDGSFTGAFGGHEDADVTAD